MANLDTTRQPVSVPVDSGAPWAPDTPYTEKNNLFRVTETIPADAVDIDGNAIVPNGLYCYPTVPHTSPSSLTVEELALMKRKGGGGDGNLFSEDMTTDAARVHTLDHDVTFKRADNAQGNPIFSHTLDSFGAIETRAYDYGADGNTVVSSTQHQIHGGGYNLRFTGEARLNVNGDNGLPGDVVVSGGGKGGQPAPHYAAQNLVKIQDMLDFTAAEPPVGLANSYNRFYNTVAGAGSDSGDTFVVGLYACVPDFNTISGFGWRLEDTNGCAISFGGEVYLDDNGTLKPMVNDGVIGTKIDETFKGWETTNADTPPLEIKFENGKEFALLQDTSATSRGSYSSNGSLAVPAVDETTLFYLRYYKENTTNAGLLRLAVTGQAADFYFNFQNTHHRFNTVGNTAILPQWVSSREDDETIEHLIRFTGFNANCDWFFNNAAASNVNGSLVDSLTGQMRILCLDEKYLPPIEPVANPLYQWFLDNYPTHVTDRGCIVPYSDIEGMGVEFVDHTNDNFVIIGKDFQINEPTFRVSLDIRKETNGNSFYTDLRDVNNLLNRLVFNPTTGAHQFTGSGGGTATARDDGDRWHVEIEFNVPLQGDHRVDFVSDWTAGGGSRSRMALYDLQFFADTAAVADNPSANGSSGYIDYPNGTRVQWGAATGSGSRTVTMPMSFINAEYNVTVNAGRAGTSVRRLAGWDDDSRTVNTFVCDAYTITNVDSAAVVYWQATGRWK